MERFVRHPRIEAFRFYSIILILIGHTLYFEKLDLNLPIAKLFTFGIALLARSTIPFFFILSGFFLGGKIIDAPLQATSIARKYTWRLGILFLVWSAIYALSDPSRSWVLLTEHPGRLIFEGTQIHLWFLVSLILTVWLFALWPMARNSWTFLALGGGLYFFGLMGGPYRLSALGLDLHFNTRDGIFFSTLFFGIGAWFHVNKPNVPQTTALWIYFIGMAIFGMESFFLSSQYRLDPLYNDFVLGSIPYGVGLFLVAYRFDPSRMDKLAAPMAVYVLGMYMSHILIIDLLLKPLSRLFSPGNWPLAIPFLVCFLTLALTAFIGKTRLKALVGMN